MKNRVDKIVVLLFVVAMCFLMSISAHAETSDRYFFTSSSLPERITEIDGVTITPTNVSGRVTADSRTIFNESVSHFARVRSDQNNATKFTIETQSKGILLVYYVRAFDYDEPVVNDGNDLAIIGMDGIVEYSEIVLQPNRQSRGVKYYVLDAGNTYTMTAPGYTCGVYGFVYMPGNVAAYGVKGKGDANLIGQFCTDYSNLPNLSEKNWRFDGWYKDEAYTEKVNEKDAITEPTILFARWTRTIWDFEEYSNRTLDPLDQLVGTEYTKVFQTIDYQGILVKGSIDGDDVAAASINNHSLCLNSTSTTEKNCVVFTPEYDGEMTVTYASTSNDVNRICAIGTDVVGNVNALENNPSVIAYGVNNSSTIWKTLHAKMKAGVTYYIYNVGGRIKIDKIQYQISAAPPVVEGDNISLTIAAYMQGWRPFYDADNSYTVDDNTKVFMAVEREGEDAVKLTNITGRKVPKGSAVILHTDAVLEDGTYQITMTKDASPYVYEGNDNLLSASVTGTPVNAYRLGYLAGEGNGVAFYSWKADAPSAGVVYLDLTDSNAAKIGFDIEENTTGIVSVRDRNNEEKAFFNLNGQRLDNPRKGFNIINGKKVIVL